MSQGTSLFDFIEVFSARLEVRAGLVDVTVYDGYPLTAIASDAIWFGNADADTEIHALRAGTKKVDEKIDLEVCVQATKTQGEGQRAADLRARELLVEVQQELAETPQPTQNVQWGELLSWEVKRGPLPSGNGHGCRFELKVRIRARLF